MVGILPHTLVCGLVLWPAAVDARPALSPSCCLLTARTRPLQCQAPAGVFHEVDEHGRRPLETSVHGFGLNLVVCYSLAPS